MRYYSEVWCVTCDHCVFCAFMLFFSNLPFNAGIVRDACLFCVKTLKISSDAGLGRSTFGKNVMSNMVTIYVVEGHFGKAQSLASPSFHTLSIMRYTGMPNHADALRVFPMVSMGFWEVK